MDDLKNLLAKRQKKGPDVHLHSAVHALADEISTAFGERKRFAMYLGVIKRVGVEAARRVYRQIEQDGNADSKGRLFMFLCRKEPPATNADGAPAEPTALKKPTAKRKEKAAAPKVKKAKETKKNDAGTAQPPLL